MPKRKRLPPLREVLDRLEAVEVALSAMMRRWDDDVTAEIRAELMTEAYEPVLHILIDTGRRP